MPANDKKMLRITQNKSAGGAKKYYSEDYYNEGKDKQLDYYSEKEQIIGKWGGIGAEKLNLGEDITKDKFALLCDNINPNTGKTLTSRNDTDRTVGYDLTFNACKSATLAHAFANDNEKKEIFNAFRQSVSDTMKEVEIGMQARVRDKGKNENCETDNIVYGEFSHLTTRPVDGLPDPHLHSHCFVFNATYDGQTDKWKAGQFRQIKQDAPYYEAFFHSKFADNLERLGYKIERTKNGFEIAGVDKATIDKFSRRTKEIEEHARENNITDEKQKANIGARTREAKRVNIDSKKEFEEWKSRLTEQEYKTLTELKNNNEGSAADSKAMDAKDAIRFALNHHLERKSVASDKEILATAIKTSVGQCTPDEIKQEFYRNSQIVKVKDGLRTFITTKDAVNEEKRLIAASNEFKGKYRPLNEGYEIQSPILNDQQQKAVKHALSTSDGVVIIAGKAGTGKTTLMTEVKKGITAGDREIFAFAPSSEASREVQRSEGFEHAQTIAHLIQNKNVHEKLKGQVIWIDEAGMVSNKDMNSILAIAKQQNARVILSGDTRQHNSVQRGDALRVMQKYAGVTPITVDKIQRQKNADYKQAVMFLSHANIEKGFKKLESIGAIKQIDESEGRIKAVADDFYKSAYKAKKEQNVLVIAPTHAEGEVITSEIRRKLKEEKQVAAENKDYNILKSCQYTEAEKAKIETYKQGDILSFHQNIIGVKAGSKLQVVKTTDCHIIVKNDAGKEIAVPVAKSDRFNVFENRNIQIAAGDKIRITGNGKTLNGKHIFNGTTYNILGFDKQGNIKLSNGSLLSKDYGHFNYGYVMTSHAAQGKTTDKIIISQSSMSFRASSMEQFYVSVSRGKHATAIYTDDKAALMQAVSNSIQRLSATELLAKNKAMEPGHITMFEKMKDTARSAFEKITVKNKDHELSREN